MKMSMGMSWQLIVLVVCYITTTHSSPLPSNSTVAEALEEDGDNAVNGTVEIEIDIEHEVDSAAGNESDVSVEPEAAGNESDVSVEAEAEVEADSPSKSCVVSDFQTQEDFDTAKFSDNGLWYEVKRTRYSDMNQWESGMASYEAHEGHTMQFSYVGTSSGKCAGPVEGYGIPVGDNPADLKMYVGNKNTYTSPFSVSFSYKLIYTDYDTVALTYACVFFNDDGTCRHPGEQVNILSRTPELDSNATSKVYDVIRERLCIDVDELVDTEREENCKALVEHDVPVDCSGRPMCLMYCENGFAKGEDGCDICQCDEEESSGESEIVGSSGEQMPESSGESEIARGAAVGSEGEESQDESGDNEAVLEEAIAEEALVEEAAVAEEALVEEATAEEALVEEAVAAEAPVEEAVAAEAPVVAEAALADSNDVEDVVDEEEGLTGTQ